MGGADKKANKDNGNDSDNDFPLAIKMMFNYYVESNAGAIFKAMKKETVVAQPSGVSLLNEDIIDESKLSVVPPHPNIVKMYAAFADSIPELENAKELYPDALPTRINPSGYGRNMSLFLVMKKYKSNLRDYLEQRPDLHWRSSLMLLAQLLEGIVHLQRHRVAHRDLKSDNILLDFEEKRASKVDDECPRLVISDFGCCLADPDHGLRLPYLSVEVDRGGNAALMAPEVANSKPGVFSFINYDKADLWAVGAMAYEIFGQNNPFYESAKPRLNNRRYRMEELPPLNDDTPPLIQKLVRSMLEINPSKRLTPEVAATIAQLILWAPRSWQDGADRLPDSQEILQWLLSLTTKILYEARFKNNPRANEEYNLVATFLSRFSVQIIKDSLEWIHCNN